MRKLILTTIILPIMVICVEAQQNPVHWSIKTSPPVGAMKAGDRFAMQVVAQVEAGWHIYSITQPEGGPTRTSISLPLAQPFKLVGAIKGPRPKSKFDENFGLDTEWYEGTAAFNLSVQVTSDVLVAGSQKLLVSVRFQACNDQICLPPKTVKLQSEIEVVPDATDKEALAQAKTSVAWADVAPRSAAGVERNGAALDFSFTDFRGRPRKFSEFRGKVVLIDFWATWCKPCLADIPHLKELYTKYRAKGFEILGMDAETLGQDDTEPDAAFAQERDERARQIVSTRGATWTQAIAGTAVPVAVKVFGVSSLPTKILLDPQGKIIARITEAVELDQLLADLLGAKQ